MRKAIPYLTIVVLITLALVSVLVIFNNEDNQSEIPLEDETIKLRIMTMFGGTDAAKEAFESQLASFMAMYPHIQVENDSMTSIGNEFRISVKTSFTTGNEPDIMFFYTGSDVEGIIKADAVMSLDEIRKTYKDFAGHINSRALESVRTSNGQVYAIPVTGFYEGLYVNKTIFDVYGLPLPSDRDSFTNAIKVLSDNGVTPIASPLGQSYYILEHFILSASGVTDYYDLLEGDIPSGWIDGLGRIKAIYDIGGFTKDSFNKKVDQAQSEFVKGEAAMIFEGSWFTKMAGETEGEIIILPMPDKETNQVDETILIGGYSSGYYISKKTYESDKQEALMLLYDYLISQESIAEIAIANGGVPSCDVSLDVTNPVAKQGLLLMSEADQLVMPIDSRLITEAFSYMVSEGLPYILYGEMSPEEVLEEVKRIQHR